MTRGEQAVFLKKFLSVGSLPQVVDATGRLVGRTTGVSESGATVAMLVQNRLVFVPVSPSGFQETSFPTLFYPGVADCSGQGFFIAVPTFAPATSSRVKGASHTLFIPDLANPQMFSATSGSIDSFFPTPCSPFSFTGTGHPAISLVDLDTLGFPTPFALL